MSIQLRRRNNRCECNYKDCAKQELCVPTIATRNLEVCEFLQAFAAQVDNQLQVGTADSAGSLVVGVENGTAGTATIHGELEVSGQSHLQVLAQYATSTTAYPTPPTIDAGSSDPNLTFGAVSGGWLAGSFDITFTAASATAGPIVIPLPTALQTLTPVAQASPTGGTGTPSQAVNTIAARNGTNLEITITYSAAQPAATTQTIAYSMVFHA